MLIWTYFYNSLKFVAPENSDASLWVIWRQVMVGLATVEAGKCATVTSEFREWAQNRSSQLGACTGKVCWRCNDGNGVMTM